MSIESSFDILKAGDRWAGRTPWVYQRELFLSEVKNRETDAIVANNDKYYRQNRIEKFQLNLFLKLIPCPVVP